MCGYSDLSCCLFLLAYGKELTQELTAHIDPDLADFVELLCQGERDQGSEVNAHLAKKDAERMSKVTRNHYPYQSRAEWATIDDTERAKF